MQELMKKIVYAIAALTLIFTGCAKELDNSTKENFSKVRLHVKVADQLTKVSADNDGRYHWQAGDEITVFNHIDEPFTFSTEQGGSDVNFGATSWSGNLGNYAMYPASDDHVVSGNEILFNLPSSFAWAENSTNMPMLGKIDENVATFKSVGGVLKLEVNNIPAGAEKLWFVSTNARITGDFEIADASISEPVIATTTELAVNDILEITFDYSVDKVFYIPLPTGEISGFKVCFLDGSDNELFSKSTASSFTVYRNNLIVAPELKITVANGTSLFSVDFGDYGASGTDWTKISGYTVSDYATAGYEGRTGYGTNGSVTLSSTGSVILSNPTSIYTGVTDGHLWFRSGYDGAVETSDINLYGATGFTLNHTQATSGSICISEYSEDGGSSWKSLGSHSGAGDASYSASVSSSVRSIKIRFRHENTNAKNARVDNIELIAGIPEPGVLVTTEAATGISATGATLNGSLDFVNGGVIGSVTEAGFVVKEGAGSYGAPITVSLGGSTNFSKTISCSDGVTYTFKAYAKYDGGSAVYGAEESFVADDGGPKYITITKSTSNFPTSYGTANTFTEYTLEDYKFKIQQGYYNSNKDTDCLQWRAAGNSSGTGTIYNTQKYPGNIKSIVIVYNTKDSSKNFSLKIGSTENPISGTSITPTNSGSTYTFDCSSYSFDYFVLTNGSNAGYWDSLTINWK